MTPEDYKCRKCHQSMFVPDGMDPLDEDVRFCESCAIDEIERQGLIAKLACAGQEQLQAELAKAEAENDKLNAELDRFPKTADLRPLPSCNLPMAWIADDGSILSMQRKGNRH